jgi:hypothetical protein
MKDLTVSINLPVKDALRVIDFLTGNTAVAAAPVAPAPVAAAPAAPVQTAAPAPALTGPNGVEVDASGSPWIADVHSDAKTKNAEGFWNGRRGKSKDVRAAAEAAARAALTGQPIPAPAVPDNTTPAGGWLPPTGAVPVAPPAMPALAMPAPVSAPAMPAPVAVTYEMVVEKYSQLSASGKMDMTQYTTICGEVGVTDPTQLQTSEPLRTAIYNRFLQIG